MTFGHASEIWAEHPRLVAGVLQVDGIERAPAIAGACAATPAQGVLQEAESCFDARERSGRW